MLSQSSLTSLLYLYTNNVISIQLNIFIIFACFQMVQSGSVFVVLFSIMKGLKNTPDVVPDPRVLNNSTSPIAVFVSTKDGVRRKNILKPVAIQIDETPGYA